MRGFNQVGDFICSVCPAFSFAEQNLFGGFELKAIRRYVQDSPCTETTHPAILDISNGFNSSKYAAMGDTIMVGGRQPFFGQPHVTRTLPHPPFAPFPRKENRCIKNDFILNFALISCIQLKLVNVHTYVRSLKVERLLCFAYVKMHVLYYVCILRDQ